MSDNQESELVQLYIQNLSEKNRIAFEIAQRCLGITFNVQKSIGFIKWKTEYTCTCSPHK